MVFPNQVYRLVTIILLILTDIPRYDLLNLQELLIKPNCFHLSDNTFNFGEQLFFRIGYLPLRTPKFIIAESHIEARLILFRFLV